MDLSDLPQGALKLIAEAEVEAKYIRRKAEQGSLSDLFCTSALAPSFELGELERGPDEISNGRNEAALHLFRATAEQLWARAQPDLDIFKARLNAAKKWVCAKFHPDSAILNDAAADWRKRARRDVAILTKGAEPRLRVGTGLLRAASERRQHALKLGQVEEQIESPSMVQTEKAPPSLKVPDLTSIGALMGKIGSHEEFLAASPRLLKAIENTDRISGSQVPLVSGRD